jgi:DNA-binding transcriptional ArsR family regulator
MSEDPIEPFKPAPRLAVEDPKQIKAFADPLRVRLLVVLAERAATNQQLADEMDEPQAKVLYHLRFLLDAGLIVLVDTRIKGGNVEKYYRAVARTYDLRPSRELQAEIVSAELSAVSHDLSASIARYPEAQRMVARTRRLAPQRAEEFFERLVALTDEFWPTDDPGEHTDDASGFVFAAFIFRKPRDEAADDRE